MSPHFPPHLRSPKGLQIAITAIAIATGIGACAITSQPSSNNSAANPSLNSPNPAPAENLPLVVVTSSVICDLTRQIAGNTINLQCLIEAGTDPHVYQPKPDDRKAIDSAQLVLYNGYSFESSLINLIKASSNQAPKLAIGELAVPNPLQDGHERAHGEKKQISADPHVWNNAQNGIKIAQAIRDSLSKLRPDQAAIYATNTAKIVSELGQIDTWIKAQIATIPPEARKLITTHDALSYYAQAYGITVEGALSGISSDEQPTAARVKELVDRLKSSQVPTIFAETSINPKLINTVAKEANVKVSERSLYVDGLGVKGSGAETYVEVLIANTRTIVEGLGGSYTPFQLK